MMPRKRDSHCFVPGCNIQYRNSNISIFGVPKEAERLKQWQRLIPRADKELNIHSGVCELHFDEQFIVRNYVHIVNGETVNIPRGRPILTSEAIPTIFPNLPKYLSISVPKKRKVRESTSSTNVNIDENSGSSQKLLKLRLTLNNLDTISLPSIFWVIQYPQNKTNCITFHTSSLNVTSQSLSLSAEKLVLVTDNGLQLKCELYLKGIKVEEFPDVHSKDMLENLLLTVDAYKLCEGAGSISEFSIDRFPAQHFIHQNNLYSTKCSRKCDGKVCIYCKYLRKLILHKIMREKKRSNKSKCMTYKLKYKSHTVRKLKKKIVSMKSEIKVILDKNKHYSTEHIMKQIQNLPLKQQEMVKHCFKAAKRKSINGLQYSKNWVLECIMMHMKSPKLYNHIRRHKIMCLPSRTTLRKYIANYSSGFGFNCNTFHLISQKMKNMDPYFRHGGLVIDEIKLSENLQAKAYGKIEGFVDIGSYTPSNMKSVPSNHGLVILYQPLVGDWCQIIGVFGTYNNIKGDLLCKLIIEATVLCENAWLHVDYVTCDAASWNRSMWKKFGIKASFDSISNKICHPVDFTRYLHFVSDFPHLIKCLRNKFIKNGFLLPEGEARCEHVKAAWIKDNCNITLKVMPKISSVHLNPNNFEKMRVSFAFQLFSDAVEKGLFLYKEDIEEQYGSIEASIKFINMMKTVIEIMTSRIPKTALFQKSSKHINKSKYEKLEEFLQYLNEWERYVGKNNKKGFLSKSTASGLRVTIKSTLDILDYLADVAGFKYIMTSRLSQDSIENIFGIVRQSSGCNDHPTPSEFLITVQCLSFYNLAKSVKGGNSEEGFITSLLSCDIMNEPDAFKKVSEYLSFNLDADSTNEISTLQFDVNTPTCQLLIYFAGYIVKKCVIKKKCESCKKYCQSTANDPVFTSSFIQRFDRGGLIYPSNSILNLLYKLENLIKNYFQNESLHRDSIIDIFNLITENNIPTVGCNEHKESLTMEIVKFYVICRLHFYIKGLNKSENNKSNKIKYLKLHRLQ